MATFNKISPCLWFDGNAEEAAAFYTKVFDGSHVVRTVRNTPSAMGAEGDVLLVDFVLEGLQFTALNGGPMFTFSEAISFQLLCQDQAEIDRYWDALVEGGEEQPCGWLKDRFGVSWQIAPTSMYEIMDSGDPELIDRVFKVVLSSFGKPVLADIQAAADA
jgi:predicted 3-demethylubiquinone-9 3-methyltransferase (glyoxalase superfamily)